MNITLLGFIVIPLGFLLFIKGRKYLMWALIISAPFFDTGIIQLHFWTTIIRPFFYFGALLLLRIILDMVVVRYIKIDLSRKETRWLIIFLFFVVLSLMMPILLEGEVNVLHIESSLDAAVRWGIESHSEPLHLGRINFTQALYPFFMIFLFFGMTSEIKTPKQLQRILKMNIALAVLVVLTGIFYQVAFASGHESIVHSLYFFMTGRSAIGLYRFTGSAGIPRLYSIVGEPGFTGTFLLVALGQIGVPIVMNRTDLLWGKRISFMIFVFLLLGLLLTGGTTGYIGIPLFLGLFLFFPNFRTRIRKIGSFRIAMRVLIITAGLFLLAYLLFNFYLKINLFDYIYQTHIIKLLGKSGSGVIRYATAIHGLKIFIQHPLLGVGIGSHQTASVITSLLSNIGLLGTIPFLLFNWIVFRKGMTVYHATKNSNLAIIVLASVISFVSLFGVMLFAKGMSSLFYLHYWLPLAMIVAAYRFHKMETTS